MPARRRSRQRALQILFLWDARRQPLDEAIAAYFDTLYSEESRTRPQPDEFVDRLVKGAVEHIEELDRRITPSTGASSACLRWIATFCGWPYTR